MRSRAAKAGASAVRPPRTLRVRSGPSRRRGLKALEPHTAQGGGVTALGYDTAETVAGGHAAAGGLPPRDTNTA